MKEDLLLHKWMQGTLSEEELSQFQGRPEYESLRKIKENTDTWAPPAADFEAMLQNILSTSKENNSPKGRVLPFNRRWFSVGIAAAITLLFLVIFWPNSDTTRTYTAAIGSGVLEGTLPDGSTFSLNAGSTLEVDQENWETERRLLLDGEAFFEVEKGNTFSVNTSKGIVSVLGTKFNVRDREQTLEVTCQEGKVQVSSLEDEIIQILTPGQGLRIEESGRISALDIVDQQSPVWTSGISSFKDVALEVVLAELERQYGVTFESGTIETKTRLTCNFTHTDLTKALATSLSPLGIEYELQGKTIVLNDGND